MIWYIRVKCSELDLSLRHAVCVRRMKKFQRALGKLTNSEFSLMYATEHKINEYAPRKKILKIDELENLTNSPVFGECSPGEVLSRNR